MKHTKTRVAKLRTYRKVRAYRGAGGRGRDTSILSEVLRQRPESLIEKTRREANMTREERKQEIAKRQKIIDGMLHWIRASNREPTQKERGQLQHQRNVIASLKLGLENELKGCCPG